MIGEAALGIYYTLENLTVSRLANAAGAMGLARKAHLESLYRTQARSAFGKPIVDHPLVRYDLTDLAVRTAAGSALLFHAVEWFDRVWHETPPYSDRYHYARFLSHLTKNRTAEHGAAATQLAMEIFGGLGFLDDFGIARLHREALVTLIWEGTSNIQALDMLEAMRKKNAHEDFLDEMLPMLKRAGTPEADRARQRLQETAERIWLRSMRMTRSGSARMRCDRWPMPRKWRCCTTWPNRPASVTPNSPRCMRGASSSMSRIPRGR